jgi:hypothetical protein
MLRKVFLAAASVAACGATTATAQGMTVSLGSPSLSARASITEPVTVSCSPFDPSLMLFQEGISVSVEQASGQGIAHASGTSFAALPTLLFPCDGSQNTILVTALADPASRPFHGGPAVFTAFASAGAGTPCFPGSTTCFFNLTSQSASSGPTTLLVH